MRLLAIDPGTTESAWVVWDGVRVVAHAKESNDTLMLRILGHDIADQWVAACVIEMVASFGMPVGAEVFETVYWIGRFAQAIGPHCVTRITRNEIKNHLCHSSRAKDANIRQAIIDRLGGPGTKKAPGLTYGISGDVWSALAVALTWWDKHHTTHREHGPLFEAHL
jgi:hypothetical protein